jgi:hypothetical protein
MPAKKTLSNREIQLALIENFVSLQKVLTNLTIKFDALSDNISKLLQLFEISAKTFIRKNEEGVPEDKEILNKLNTLLEQNKTVAKGLTLVEEKIRHKMYGDTTREELSEFGLVGNRMGMHGLKPKPLPKT